MAIGFGRPLTIGLSYLQNFVVENTCSFPIDFELISFTSDIPIEPETPKTNNTQKKNKGQGAKSASNKNQEKDKSKKH